jgi:hypothetical protein
MWRKLQRRCRLARAPLPVAARRDRNAGRVGFVIPDRPDDLAGSHRCRGLTPLTDVVRISGPAAHVIRAVLAHAWVAQDFDAAREAAGVVPGTVVTPDGDVFRGVHVVEGGVRAEARGILATKREIKDSRNEQRTAVDRVREVVAIDLHRPAGDPPRCHYRGAAPRERWSDSTCWAAIAGAEDCQARQIASSRSAERSSVGRWQEEARQSISRIEADQREATMH